jgi:hypothetical protein
VEGAILWKDLGLSPQAWQKLGFSWAVYDIDEEGDSRPGWIEWAFGMRKTNPDPAGFGVMTLSGR